MTESERSLRRHLLRSSERVRELLRQTRYIPPEGNDVSIKSLIETLLPVDDVETPVDCQIDEEIRNFLLCCAVLASSRGSSHSIFSWIPENLQTAAVSAFRELSSIISSAIESKQSDGLKELGLESLDYGLIPKEKLLVVELIPVILPLLKNRIKESSIDASDEGSELFAASARVPVAYAIVASYQFRWLVTQVEYHHELGKLAFLVIPCGLTALDHWCPEVKGQGMISFIHLAKHVDVAAISVYKEVILDACCHNIPSADEIWHLAVEMAVLLVTRINHGNPRSSWYERMMNEMLSHLERQPRRNKERRIAWLQHVEPLFHDMGLVLLAHFRHLFPLFFQWMHADDDPTVLLTLNRIYTVLKLTWIRNSSYTQKLVDEVVFVYKEAALRTRRDEIRSNIVQILTILHQCHGRKFEETWKKHMEDPNLSSLANFFRPLVPDSGSRIEVSSVCSI